MTRLLTLISAVCVLAAALAFSASPSYRVGFVGADSALSVAAAPAT